MWRKLALVALLAAALVWLVVHVQKRRLIKLLPATASAQGAEPTPVRGAYHIHSELSHDSELSVDVIAEAAAGLGLDFVILTDHNVQSAGASERHGVVVLSYAELSTSFGHLVQLGANDVLSKDQRGELDLNERVAALGGRAIVAHPDDRKRPWEGSLAGAGGVEIANASSSARRRGGPLFLGLLPAVVAMKWRPELALAQAYDRDGRALRRWDGESDPAFAGLCGVDAHGRIDLGSNLRLWQLVLPELSAVELKAAPGAGGRSAVNESSTSTSAPMTTTEAGERTPAMVRGGRILEEIRAGRFYCNAALLSDRPHFRFFAVSNKDPQKRLAIGGSIREAEVDELVVEGPESNAAPATLVMLRNGEEVLRSQGNRLRYAEPSPGTYRVEVRLPIPNVVFGKRSVSAIYSGRIRVLAAGALPKAEDDSMAVSAQMSGTSDEEKVSTETR